MSSVRSAVVSHKRRFSDGTTMAAPPEEPSLSAEQRRALKLLARIPGGATEATLFAHGFWRETLAGLVLAGLATVTTAFVRAGGPMMKVDRYRITAAGRSKVDRALQSLIRCASSAYCIGH
jgi:hypothetical protein